MKQHQQFLLDTHTLIFWEGRHSVSDEFIAFIDNEVQHGNAFASSISFWEAEFLIQRNRVKISDAQTWKDGMFANTGLHLLNPTATQMINSVRLPQHHKDPFDRLLVSQAQANNLVIITRDSEIEKYDVETFWMK